MDFMMIKKNAPAARPGQPHGFAQRQFDGLSEKFRRDSRACGCRRVALRCACRLLTGRIVNKAVARVYLFATKWRKGGVKRAHRSLFCAISRAHADQKRQRRRGMVAATA
jgi:hypothetical protein